MPIDAAVLVCLLLVASPPETPAAPDPAADAEAAFRAQVEADWLIQERFRGRRGGEGSATAADDAAGGCDGVKDGAYGFHTGLAVDPWWQVDLGEPRKLGRVAVWNRGDGAGERAFTLRVLLSGDGTDWAIAYEHDGSPFGGLPSSRPLEIDLAGREGRFLRIQLRGSTYLHLDEVEVFDAVDPGTNLARGRPADQVSASTWSRRHASPEADLPRRTAEIVARSRRLAAELAADGVETGDALADLERLVGRLTREGADASPLETYLEARWIQRRLTLRIPLLDFDAILFAKRVPGSFNHMSDQYIGWWSRPGGGLFILRDFKGGVPRAERIAGSPGEDGSVLRPDLSADAGKALFAWCRHHPGLAGEPNKLDKANVPEDAFYHIFEIGLDGSGLRQLTRGKYDDFDARYLPDGRIVFLSTRRGQFVQCGPESARATLAASALPDVYVRCGGGPERPCVVYTLHTMDADGGGLCAISPFEMFEWTPSVAADGSILYSRWDYIDRDNMPYMKLWTIRPDGTDSRIVYGNFERAPHCTFEPRQVPGSRKIVFTASAHHAQTKGSLVLLDPAVGPEGDLAVRRLTPEVPFPEAEGWPESYYAGPFPLSERFYLVAWGCEGAMAPPTSLGWDRWHSVLRPANGMGLYIFDAEGNLELLYRDPAISSGEPIPVRPRASAPAMAPVARWDHAREGTFVLTDVYRGLPGAARGDIRALRIVAVPPKTHPTMNFPAMGLTADDPGKCVLGTVPVEEDGSAWFRVPSGTIVFFQALDARGMAVQTMRSATHVQPGETLGCIGCHEPRTSAPPAKTLLATRRDPSPIRVGPEGSWPFRYDRLVQPVLDARCVECHAPGSADPEASKLDLTAPGSYQALAGFGSPSLQDHVRHFYRQGSSTPGRCGARESPILRKLTAPEGHHGVTLSCEDLERLVTWLDTYGQRLGSFDEAQERQLVELREASAPLLVER